MTTTIYNSDGTTTTVHNRSGKTIQTIVAAGETSATAAVIPHYSQRDIVFISLTPFTIENGSRVPGTTNDGVMMPSNADIGDEIEIYQAVNPPIITPPGTVPTQGYPSPLLYFPTGTTLNESTPPAAGLPASGKFMLVSATNWIQAL